MLHEKLLNWFLLTPKILESLVLTFSCLRAGLCGGWVIDLLWWGAWGVPVGKKLLLNFQAVDLQLH